MSDGTVVALHLNRRRHAPLEPVEQVHVTAAGIEGDIHAGRLGGRRQVLIVDAGDLERLGLAPGDLREQVTVDLPELMATAAGTRLALGRAEVEVTGPCEPCTHIGEHLGAAEPEALRRRLMGRRGMLARVTREGRIAVGDAVVLAATVAR